MTNHRAMFGAWRENFDNEIGCAPHPVVDDTEAFGRNKEEMRLYDERRFPIQYDVCAAHFSKLVFANMGTEKFGEAEQDPAQQIQENVMPRERTVYSTGGIRL